MSQPAQFPGEPQLPDPYAFAYAPAAIDRSAAGMAIASFVVACGFGFLMILNSLAAGPAVASLEDASGAGSFDDTWGLIYDGTAVALLPAILGVWVVTCIWLVQIRQNAKAVNPVYPHARRVGWVWAGWLVPVVNLWFPFQVVRDVYAAVTRALVPAVMRWWWGLWLVMLFASRILDSVMTSQLENLNFDSGPVVVLGVITAGATAGALVMWGLTIRHLVSALNRADRAPVAR